MLKTRQARLNIRLCARTIQRATLILSIGCTAKNGITTPSDASLTGNSGLNDGGPSGPTPSDASPSGDSGADSGDAPLTCTPILNGDFEQAMTGWAFYADGTSSATSTVANKVFTTIVPRNVRLAEAPSYGLPGVVFDRNSRGAQAYLAFAEEMIARVDTWKEEAK